jgi:hypothetical protein
LRSQDRVAAAELTQQGIEALDSPRSSGSLGQWQDRLLVNAIILDWLHDRDTVIWQLQKIRIRGYSKYIYNFINKYYEDNAQN